jgi:glycosyltransferase involved in cell wall biosynthesis
VTALHVVVPDSMDDPQRPSGGNVYDRKVCRGLAAMGWCIHEHPMSGSWPDPDAAALAGLGGVLGHLPDGSLVLLDGLVASAAPEVMSSQADRLRLVVLVHMPLGAGAGTDDANGTEGREGVALSAAAAVVTTSQWTARWLRDRYGFTDGEVHVVEPGVEPADTAPGSATGERLLCVGAVTPGKGHAVLVAALATIMDLPWRCVCVGALDLEPGLVHRLRCSAEESGIADRFSFTGPLTGGALDRAYAESDVLVLASHAETYAMVVTEALARGLPVVATRVGGVPEALGRVTSGARAGLLVPPGDAPALAEALRCWLVDPGRRQRLREAALERRLTLADWGQTTHAISRVLSGVMA